MRHLSTTPPRKFICPLTLQLMHDPVLSRWGHTYEKSAILLWLDQHDCCPMTRKPLKPSSLIKNAKLQEEIRQWKLANGYTSMNDETEPPIEFICPLTREVMVHPVMTKYGDRYERSAIQEWLSGGNDFCPLTGKPLRPSHMVSDTNLKKKIHIWKQETGYFGDLASDEEEMMLDASWVIAGSKDEWNRIEKERWIKRLCLRRQDKLFAI